MKLIRPGALCCDIAEKLNKICDGPGLLPNRTLGYGHSFGILSHYCGREASRELREDIETMLEPGMVVSMEPMIMVPEGEPGAGGYRERDKLVVTEEGAKNVTNFPCGPERNIIAAQRRARAAPEGDKPARCRAPGPCRSVTGFRPAQSARAPGRSVRSLDVCPGLGRDLTRRPKSETSAPQPPPSTPIAGCDAPRSRRQSTSSGMIAI